jgi:hypothetical protein
MLKMSSLLLKKLDKLYALTYNNDTTLKYRCNNI